MRGRGEEGKTKTKRRRDEEKKRRREEEEDSLIEVGRGDCSPPPLTDPDVRDYRIRLLGLRLRCSWEWSSADTGPRAAESASGGA